MVWGYCLSERPFRVINPIVSPEDQWWPARKRPDGDQRIASAESASEMQRLYRDTRGAPSVVTYW